MFFYVFLNHFRIEYSTSKTSLFLPLYNSVSSFTFKIFPCFITVTNSEAIFSISIEISLSNLGINTSSFSNIYTSIPSLFKFSESSNDIAPLPTISAFLGSFLSINLLSLLAFLRFLCINILSPRFSNSFNFLAILPNR